MESQRGECISELKRVLDRLHKDLNKILAKDHPKKDAFIKHRLSRISQVELQIAWVKEQK